MQVELPSSGKMGMVPVLILLPMFPNIQIRPYPGAFIPVDLAAKFSRAKNRDLCAVPKLIRAD